MAESKVAVYGAIVANVAIAVTKFIVAGVSGSSAMLSEAIHSTVDTGNDLLLLVGMRVSKKPPNVQHPFGHGRELYFWSLIVAVLIFGLGGGMSIFEGVQHMRQPEPLHDAFWNYVVLGASAVFEGTSFVIALRTFRRSSRRLPLWQAIRQSKDPTTYTVLAEDGAALAGLGVAAAGVAASHLWNMPVLDGAASVCIGILLAGVAILLIREARGLLVGEGVLPETAAAIRAIAMAQPGVERTGPALSMYIGPEEALLTMDVYFASSATVLQWTQATSTIKRTVGSRFPNVKRIYLAGHPNDGAGSQSD